MSSGAQQTYLTANEASPSKYGSVKNVGAKAHEGSDVFKQGDFVIKLGYEDKGASHFNIRIPLAHSRRTVPIYDCREMDVFAAGNMPPTHAPLYKHDLPKDSIVVVGHTINTYDKKIPNQPMKKCVTLNVLWVALLDGIDVHE